MKRTVIISLIVLVLAGLTSCSIQKRHYRDGFYVDWNRSSAQPKETVALSEPASVAEVPMHRTKVADTSVLLDPDSKKADMAEVSVITPEVIRRNNQQETQEELQNNPEKSKSPAPLEKDKGQAIGAGVAAAIFFALGMVGLIIKGTAPPTGIFIVAAFVCCVLCIMLASFLYPREPQVKQPKDEIAVKNPGIAGAGIGLLIVTSIIVLTIGAFFLSIFTSLFF